MGAVGLEPTETEVEGFTVAIPSFNWRNSKHIAGVLESLFGNIVIFGLLTIVDSFCAHLIPPVHHHNSTSKYDSDKIFK